MGSEQALVQQLRSGDEAAFTSMVAEYQGSMVRIAQRFVRSRSVAQEVVQETWLAVLHGIQRFEGRSSLKTWIFRILTNRARTRGRREARCLPLGETDVVRPPAWSQDPWHHNPEHNVLRLQARRQVSAALECLPERQRAVVTLRDVRGLSSQEAADELQISEGNQRVLLHRGRSHARRHLEHGMISALAS